ncbi:MAG: SPOR domain-containing protein [Phaeodactylibacter sp.]|nr:SPOR domain-containing protein [Phaeodactylibacter sp.]MCB9052126.1 SPOR domain-containing protein [Lewinellaceae bacterium]
MKELTVILLFISLLLSPPASTAQAGNWLSFVAQAEGRPGGNTSWNRVQRLEVSKKIGVAVGQGNTAGAIRFNPEDKEVRLTFSNFTINGAWFIPTEVAVEYKEEGRVIGPIKALPGPGNSDYFQMTLRFREKTAESLLSVSVVGRTSGQFVKDTINTVLMWGSAQAEASNVQVSYLDNTGNLTARSPYTEAVQSYGADQGRIEPAGQAYAIQLGAYTVVPDNRQFAQAAAYGQLYYRRIGNLFYIRVGTYNDNRLAQQYLQSIRNYYPEAYIVLEDSPLPAAGRQAADPYVSPYGQPDQYGAESTPRIPAIPGLTPKEGAASSYILPAGITGNAIQLASLATEEKGVSYINNLRGRGISDLYLWQKDGKNRVVVAPFPSKRDAANYLETLKRQYKQDGILVYID